jgi:hypothetical protein
LIQSHGIVVATPGVMTTNRRPLPSSEPHPVLCWIFQRHADAITCELDLGADRSYDVCVVPHWDVSSSLVEHFQGPAGALWRHAEIASRLRERGWVLTDHASHHDVPTAA